MQNRQTGTINGTSYDVPASATVNPNFFPRRRKGGGSQGGLSPVTIQEVKQSRTNKKPESKPIKTDNNITQNNRKANIIRPIINEPPTVVFSQKAYDLYQQRISDINQIQQDQSSQYTPLSKSDAARVYYGSGSLPVYGGAASINTARSITPPTTIKKQFVEGIKDIPRSFRDNPKQSTFGAVGMGALSFISPPIALIGAGGFATYSYLQSKKAGLTSTQSAARVAGQTAPFIITGAAVKGVSKVASRPNVKVTGVAGQIESIDIGKVTRSRISPVEFTAKINKVDVKGSVVGRSVQEKGSSVSAFILKAEGDNININAIAGSKSKAIRTGKTTRGAGTLVVEANGKTSKSITAFKSIIAKDTTLPGTYISSAKIDKSLTGKIIPDSRTVAAAIEIGNYKIKDYPTVKVSRILAVTRSAKDLNIKSIGKKASVLSRDPDSLLRITKPGQGEIVNNLVKSIESSLRLSKQQPGKILFTGFKSQIALNQNTNQSTTSRYASSQRLIQRRATIIKFKQNTIQKQGSIQRQKKAQIYDNAFISIQRPITKPAPRPQYPNIPTPRIINPPRIKTPIIKFELKKYNKKSLKKKRTNRLTSRYSSDLTSILKNYKGQRPSVLTGTEVRPL